MTIYVDELMDYGMKGINLPFSDYWYYMATDSDDLEELHSMASNLNLRRSYFQDNYKVPHYDLVKSKREQSY